MIPCKLIVVFVKSLQLNRRQENDLRAREHATSLVLVQQRAFEKGVVYCWDDFWCGTMVLVAFPARVIFPVDC